MPVGYALTTVRVQNVVRTRVSIEPGGIAMASDLRLRAMNGVHRLVIRATGGRLGWEGGGMPVLELTTIGRTSGRERVTMLTSPRQEDVMFVVVALGGGGSRHPAWYLNLREMPEVTVRWQGEEPRPMVASIAGADLRTRLWPMITEAWPDYAKLQSETDLQLPLVLLAPRAET